MAHFDEHKLEQIAQSLAERNFENFHGIGFHHASKETQRQLVQEARKEVDVWVKRLSPAVTE